MQKDSWCFESKFPCPDYTWILVEVHNTIRSQTKVHKVPKTGVEESEIGGSLWSHPYGKSAKGKRFKGESDTL